MDPEPSRIRSLHPLLGLTNPHNEPVPHEDQINVPSSISNLNSNYFLEILKIITYDLVIWFFDAIIHTFFRDIRSRGTFNIPKQGPIVFVIAPHHNQFIDGLVVMSIVRQFANRRISYLIAAKSYRRKFIGTASMLCSAIPVERAQDLLKSATGTIKVKDVEHEEDNLVVFGTNTRFTSECMVKGLIGLPNSLGNAQIDEIISDTELRLKKPFKYATDKQKRNDKDEKVVELLTNGTKFKSAPHVDNNQVFDNVFKHLASNKVLGMFPEGGSHDRPDLLPLKPGVAIMALGAAAKSTEPGQVINVIPVGLNYFHPHKFRSRVVIEFGAPIKVTQEDGRKYQENSREEVAKLLDIVELRLREVTVTCDDYDTLMALQAARRLYTSLNRETIPLPLVVEMNRRLIKGYNQHAENPDVIQMKKAVSEYNKKLMRLGLHDHQVESLNNTNRVQVLIMFASRLFKVMLFFFLSLPGVIMFSPVFVIAKLISKKKQEEALAGSVVKIKAKDVLGTWKILVAMGIAPMLYIFWSICGTILVNRLGWAEKFHLSNWFTFIVFYGWSVLTTYASLRIGEIGVDYYKSLKPLVYSLLSHHMDSKQIDDLKKNRQVLAEQVTQFCNSYGPDIFEDYEAFYKKYNNMDESDELISRPRMKSRYLSKLSTKESYNLSNLSDIPIFSNANFLDTFTNEDSEGSSDKNVVTDESEESEEESEENEEKEQGEEKVDSKRSQLRNRLRRTIRSNRKKT